MDKRCVITCALAGARTTKEQNPAVPYGVDEIIEAAVRSYEAGAAVVHIHVRREDGTPTHDPEYIGPVVEGIRKRCPVLINLSSAIGGGKTPEERLSVITNFAPDLASLNSGTMNFGRANWKTGEILMGIIFQNTFDMIVNFAREMKRVGTKPELEVYDISHIDTVMLLRKQGIFDEPLHFQFVTGVAGGIRLTPLSVAHFLRSIPEDASWGICGVGPNSFLSAMLAATWGGNIRVGLEDNLYVRGKELAKGNYELVEKAVEIAKIVDRRPATPEEARVIFNLPKR